MKKLITGFAALLMALTSLTLTSCDPDSDIAYTLWGTWQGDIYAVRQWNGSYYYASYSQIAFDHDPSTRSSGTGYWVDYFSGAPWDYLASHIQWTVVNGEIHVYFVEDDYSVVICDYRLSDYRFEGYIYVEDGTEQAFSLQKTSSPDWDSFYYGYDSGYYGYSNRARGMKAATADATAERPLRLFMKP